MDDYAIVVGVCKYPQIGDLAGCEVDARDFLSWVTDPAGGNVGKDHYKLIVSSDFDNAGRPLPTAQEIEAAFEWLDGIAEEQRNANKGHKIGRRLYLYFSGHGFAPAFDDAALLMANARPRGFGNHIAGKLWAEWFRRSGYFDEIVLFMDCCRDRYSSVGLRQPHLEVGVDTTGFENRARFYAFAAPWDRKAWERTDPQTGEVSGAFTKALLAGLRGQAAEPETGRITAASLRSYLYNNMRNFLTEKEGTEGKEPYIEDLSNPANPLVFATIPVAQVTKVQVSVDIPPQGIGQPAEIIADDENKPVASTPAAPPVWQVQLVKGLYELRAAGGVSRLFKVVPSMEAHHV